MLVAPEVNASELVVGPPLPRLVDTGFQADVPRFGVDLHHPSAAAWLGHVAIHPMPPRLRFRGFRRIEKTGFQRIGGRGGGSQHKANQCNSDESNCFCHFVGVLSQEVIVKTAIYCCFL